MVSEEVMGLSQKMRIQIYRKILRQDPQVHFRQILQVLLHRPEEEEDRS
jgi:hypothetical protein